MTSANLFSTDGAAPTPVSPLRVMMVCTGNICRSPMAEIVLRARLREQSLDDRVVVDSTGISSEEHGNPIDRRARAALTRRGYAGHDVDAHRARPSRIPPAAAAAMPPAAGMRTRAWCSSAAVRRSRSSPTSKSI